MACGEDSHSACRIHKERDAELDVEAYDRLCHKQDTAFTAAGQI